MKLRSQHQLQDGNRSRTSRIAKKDRLSRKRRSFLVESLEDRRLLAVVWDRIEPAGSLIFQAEVAGELSQTIYSDDFESGSLGAEWSTRSLQNPIVNSLSVADDLISGVIPRSTVSGTINQADLRDVIGGPSGNWGFNNPMPGPGGDDYAVLTTGTLDVITPGTFTFAVSGDDGGRLRIDGADVIVDDALHAFTNVLGDVQLDAGSYTFEWLGIERLGGAGFELAVAVGAGNTLPITEANGWQVIGSPTPHPEIQSVGALTSTAYYPTPNPDPNGRIEVSSVRGTPTNSGAFHLAMDRAPSGAFTLNEAVLTVDLSATPDATLAFAHKDVGDEDTRLPDSFDGSTVGDGASISADGNTWYTLVSLNNANSPNQVYTEFEFDLAAAAASAGISLGPNFQIKFQQYDNFPFNSDGRTFDDVTISAPALLPETTTAFLEADQTLTVVASPDNSSTTLTATVRDPNNVVLATATAAAAGETLEIQTIGIATDGVYSIEITGDGATEYDLSLYRNASVEVFDTDDGAEQDATGSFIPLGSGRFGIVGNFDGSPDDGGEEEERPVVWGIQPNSGSILKINPVDGSIIGSFPAPDALTAAHRVNGLSIAEDGETLLYVNGGVNGNDLYRLDPNDGTVLSIELLPTGDFSPTARGGLSFDSGTPDSIFAIDDGLSVDRQAGFGGPLTDWTPGSVGFPGALGGDDNGRLFVVRAGQIEEYSTTVANTLLNSFPIPGGSSGSTQGLAFDGVNLYSTDTAGNLFTLDPDTGALLNQVTVAGGFLTGLGADIVGGGGTLTSGPIYTTQEDGTRLGTIDKATGVGTDIGPFGSTQTWAAAFDTDGTLYTTTDGFSGNSVLASVDTSTGAVTTIGSGLGTSLISLEVAADGTMYGIGYNDRILYEIDQTTGLATPIGDTGITFNMDLAFDSAGVMYATVNNRIYTIDTATANSTLLGTYSGIVSGSVMGIMFDETDTLLATAYVPNSPLYEIDLNTLAATVIGDTGFLRPHGGDILITSSGPAVPGRQAIVPEANPEFYGDPGEPGRFPPGPNVPAQTLAPGELLVNGSFETGGFDGWTTVVTGTPFRDWSVDGAGVGGGFGMLQTQPQDGAFVAGNGFDGNGPMEFQMYQDVTIPAGSTATLSWMDRAQWNYTFGPVTLPRLYDVQIRDPGTSTVLETAFSFSTGIDPGIGNTDWQTHSVDVSAYAGQTVRVFFREQIQESFTGPGQVEIDAVSLTTDVGGATETLYGGVSRGSSVNPGGVLLVDQTTAAGTLLADPITPGGLPGLAFDSTGRLWGASIDGPGGNRVSDLVEIDPDTGALISSVPITRLGIPVSIGDLAIQPGTDSIFAVHSNSDATSFPGGELYTIDRATGAATFVGNLNTGAGGGIAFTPDGRLYQTAFNAPSGTPGRFQSLNEIDPSDGSRISTTALTPAVYFDGLSVRPSDGTLFATAGGTGQQVFTIDASSGAATFVGDTGAGSPSDLAFRVTSDDEGGPDVDEYLLDLTGKAGQPIDIALSTDIDISGGTGAQFNDSLTQTNVVSFPNVLDFDFSGAPSPSGDATLQVDAIADLNGTTEFLTLDAEGIFTQQLFVTGGLQQQPSSTTVSIPEATLALLAADGTVSFTVTPSSGVNNLGPNSLTLELTYAAASGGNVTLELLDVDGTTVLATGMAVSDNFDLGILDFVVPADGVYTVRASSTGQGAYGIVVTDPLIFDTEPSQPNDSPLRSLDAYEGALGFLSDSLAGGDVDLSLINSFESLNSMVDSGFIPPDPIIAAGPESVITMVNTDIAIHNKTTGAVIAKSDLDGGGGFWATNNTVFDPWITYDPDSGRFFAIGVDRITSGLGSSRIYLSVSTDSTPTNLTTDWNKYIIDRTGTHTGTGGTTFPDYPKLGVNDEAIYITGNDFGIAGGGLSHVSLFAIEKGPLLTGGPANIVYDEVIPGAFSVHPVINFDPGAPMRFAEAQGSTGIRIHTLSDVLTAPTRTTETVNVPTFFFPPDVPQQGGPVLDSVSERIMSGVVRDGSLWTAHAIVDPAVDTETVMRWYEFDVSGAASLVQNGNVDPGPGIHTWMGHVNVDNDGDMAIIFSMSGPTQFAGIGYTGRLATDPLGTTRPVETARAGEGPYSRFDSIGRNRWGDYSGLAIDPDGESFWLYNEYAASGNNWGTFVGSFQVEPAGTAVADVDTYEISLASGQQIGLSTLTPFDDPIDGLNLLDPSLEVLDPSGASVAFDSGSAADGKNASLPTFTAGAAGVYKVIVAAEDDGDGEYVLSVNWAPVIGPLALSAGMILENEKVSLSGSYSDQNIGDSHTVVVDWDDPNDAADSTFAVPAINTLSVGDSFSSTTDGAELEITSLDLLTGEVGFEVTDHQYLDDGLAPGNGTPSDTSTVTVTITDSGGLVAAPLTQEFIINGGFETGDFTGWTVSNGGSQSWVINDGTFIPSGPGGALPPIGGNFDALTTGGAGFSILSEPIVVPNSVSSATLSWSDRIRNFASTFSDPNQEWRVLILDAGGSLIQEVFSTDPGDPLQQLGPNDRSYDLTSLFQSLAGQTIQISFEKQDNLFFFNATLDNVSLQVSSAPSVLVKNVAPIISLDPVATINENEAASLTGTITDQGLLDEHDLVIAWDDPNDPADATFAIPATAALTVGNTFSSTTDGAVLTVTGVDLSIGEVSFSVEHVYADDGPAPGNGTASDTQLIRATVVDDDTLPNGVPSFLPPVNLGTVNTTSNDVAPTLSADGLTIYFHSNRPGGNGGADIWQATRSSLSEPFGTPTNIGNAVNSGANDTAPALSKDGLSLYFSSTRSGGNGSADIYVATRASTSDPFGVPINVGSGVSTNLPEFAPAVSADGLSLYFQRRNDANGVGSDDIWVATRASTSDPFGTAVNLGATINYVGFDGGPFISDDELALYYGSNRAGGEGQIDLYVATRDNASDAFGPPINLGVPVNSTLQDFNAHLGPDGLYFHSNRPGGLGGNDLWFAAFAGTTTATVRVENVAPTIDAIAVSATKDNKAVVGQDVTLAATFTDVGLLDRHDVVVGWDDGTADSVFDVDATADLSVGDSFTSTSGDGAVLTITGVDSVTGEVSFDVASHQFATGGIFEVIVTISDDDTGQDDRLTEAWVSGVRIKDGVLQVIGTSLRDQVTINQQGNGTLTVHADFLQNGNFETFVTAEVDKIIAYLCEGDDHFTIAGNVDIAAIVHGGGGDDHLNGGRGPVVLLGDEGNDTLIGGSGRDILIGGLHNDRIIGAQDEDLLIGGTTSFDDDDEALMTLLAEWNSDPSYSDRADAVDALLTVIDDETEDQLTGSSGQDLFYDGLGDVLTDVKTNKDAETVL